MDCLSYTTWYSWYTAKFGGVPPDMSQIAPAVSPPGEEFSQSKGEVIRNGTTIEINFTFNL